MPPKTQKYDYFLFLVVIGINHQYLVVNCNKYMNLADFKNNLVITLVLTKEIKACCANQLK